MPLKACIQLRVPAGSVAARVAPELRSCVDLKVLQDQFYHVITFPSQRGHSESIVDSPAMHRALKRLPETADPIVAIAHNFTAEANTMLAARSGIVFSLRDSFWSDELWAKIRALYF